MLDFSPGEPFSGDGTFPVIIPPSDRAHPRAVGKAQTISRYASRLLDISVASLALIVLAVPMAVIALVIRATSSGPALFRQTRIGYRGAPFAMLKFRSMYEASDDEPHRNYVRRMLTNQDEHVKGPSGLFKLDQDPRVTRVGSLLRRTSLDELPQLFNVLRGEMALVGPRPALPWEVTLYQAHHHLRFEAKPGITGLWQISGRNRLSMNEALELDVQYVKRWSLGLDLRILMATLPAIMRGEAR
jgi:lipopolysaccharide/colanic/teichoic acid biosynthesis glycosyltransferase